MIVELAILPGRTDHLEVRLRPPEGEAVLVSRVPVSDPGMGEPGAAPAFLMLRPRDAELVASAILEASRRALALT